MNPDHAFLFAAIAAAYLIGSVPFGLILTRLAGLGDIRQIGSGNIGATNVLRTGSRSLAALTLLLDMLKGLVAVLMAEALYPDPSHLSGMLACVLVVCGHCYPVWLRFRGGKGVSTAMGAALALNPFIGLGGAVTWIIMVALFRYSSLAALVAVATLPGFAWYLGHLQYIMPLVLTALLVLIRHKDNIQRLLDGSEPKIGQKT